MDFDKAPIHSGSVGFHSLHAVSLPRFAPENWPEGWTPLIAAASKWHFDICRRLVDAGSDINAQGDNGVTALGQVIGVRLDRRVGDPMAALRRLLGGDDESDDDEAAEDEETLEMARFMLEKGASPQVTAGPDQELLVDLASNQDDQSLLDLLLSFGAEAGANET